MNLSNFGKQLREKRLAHQWSSMIAAHQLGVSATYYSRLENGRERPSRAILDRIGLVYNLPAEDLKLFELLAGYGTDSPTSSRNTIVGNGSPEAMKVRLDPEKHQILFSDALLVSSSSNGVVFDFGQKSGPLNEIVIVSRVGISVEHAQEIYKALGQHIKKK